MEKSESIAELSKALCGVQKELKSATKDSENPYFKSTYASLISVWDAIRALLAKNGLSVSQLTSGVDDSSVIIETMLMHTSGEWICGSLYMPLTKKDPQAVGSAITYGRRYGLSAIIGVCQDDDDAESAMRGVPSANKEDVKQEQTPSKPQRGRPPSDSKKNIDKLKKVVNEQMLALGVESGDRKSFYDWYVKDVCKEETDLVLKNFIENMSEFKSKYENTKSNKGGE